MSDTKFSSALTCNHCGNKAPMAIVSKYSRIRTHEHEGSPMVWDEGPFWEMLECPACKGISFISGYWHEYIHDETGPDYELLYPAKAKLIRGLPPGIAKSFEAAQKVKPIDTNAFAVLLGRVLDMVCIDKKANGDSLFNRLKDIADKGIMPQQLADMAHQLRQLRNIGAHADLGELTDAEIPILESLSNAILEYVYSAPALVQLVQSKIDALKEKKP
ncbi:DUF4145 domain-containing protein [Shewanella profunda]|uniref:DUF4145 domain-containing protein n=1 Tax=Shewanella profunda TaxID=254793 RepID=UPI00200CA6C1|nr:DUF4145 domain-containing protein [Shewanella profunda]MCL1089634.1 DUF4145 domain-containing protein [Shewanella profunda]